MGKLTAQPNATVYV